MINKLDHWDLFAEAVHKHIKDYVIPQYGDFPDKTIAKYTPEKIQGKLEAYVDRIGRNSRGDLDAARDCLKIAHFACYLHYILRTGKAEGYDNGII